MNLSNVRPRRGLFFVRKYVKPEKVGSIYLNPAWLRDNSRSLWEALERTELPTLGLTVEPGWIVVTAPNRGVHVDSIELEETQDLFPEIYEEMGATFRTRREEVYALSKAEVARVIPYSEDGETPEIVMAPDRILVKMLPPETGSLLAPDWTFSTRGEIIEVGPEVREALDVGDIVHYTEHAGLQVELEGVKHLIMREDEILWREV